MYPKRLPYSGSPVYLLRFAQGAPGRGSSEWSIYYDTSLGQYPQIFGPNGKVILSSSDWAAQMAPNTWHLVRITVATGNGLTTVQVDGNPTVSQSTSPGYDGEDWQLSMGDFVGCIDEVRISYTTP